MALYNSNSQNSKIGDIILTNKKNINDKYIELTNEQQVFSSQEYPKLADLECYIGEGGITDLTFNNYADYSTFSRNSICIKKNENEVYLIKQNSNYKIFLELNTNNMLNQDNNNLLVAQISSISGYYMSACFKEDDLYIFFGSGDIYCSVYDTVNNVFKTQDIRIVSFQNSYIFGIHNNKNTGKINVFVRFNDTSMRCYSTTDGFIFTSELIATQALNRLTTTTGNLFNKTKDGDNFYYNGKYYFFDTLNSNIFSVDEINYNITVEKEITISYSKYLKQIIQCNTKGLFFMLISTDSNVSQILHSTNGIDNITIEDYNYTFPTNSEINLIEDNVLFIIDGNDIYVNYDFLNEDFNIIYNDLKTQYNTTIIKNNEYLNIYRQSESLNFIKTETENPILIPKKPVEIEDLRYGFYLKAK